MNMTKIYVGPDQRALNNDPRLVTRLSKEKSFGIAGLWHLKSGTVFIRVETKKYISRGLLDTYG